MAGEKGRRQGDLFEGAATSLVTRLGYKELVTGYGKNGIDMIARPPTGYPEPLFKGAEFAPSGDTAFEFTSDWDIGPKIIDELANKVESLNNKGTYPVEGGVIICDQKVSDKIYENGLDKKIYIWDFRDCSFLATKIRLKQEMDRSGNAWERRIKEGASYLWSLDRETRPGFFRSRVALLFHNPLSEVNSSNVTDAIQEITRFTKEEYSKVGLYLFPMQAEISIISRSYLTKDVENKIGKILSEYSSEETLVYTLRELITLYVAPWSAHISI